MEKFKMSSFSQRKGNKFTIPRFSDIDLEFVKDYLYVDYEDDDMLISLLIQSAKEMVSEEISIDEEEGIMPISIIPPTNGHPLDKSDLASTLVLMIVSDLYNNRSTTATDVKIKLSPLFTEMKKTLRGKMGGYRL